MSQRVARAIWGPSRSGTNRPPTPLGRDSLTYPVFAATDRRLLVVLVPVFVVIFIVLEAPVPTGDRNSGFRKFSQVKMELPLVPAETLSRCV